MTDGNNKKKESIQELYERLIKEMNESKKNHPEMWKGIDSNVFNKLDDTYQRFYGNKHNDCLHDNCDQCNGTGINKETKAVCIHMISCPCERCTPRF